MTLESSDTCQDSLFQHAALYAYHYGPQPRRNFAVCVDNATGQIYLVGGVTSFDGDIHTHMPCPMSQIHHFSLHSRPALLDVVAGTVPLPREGHISLVLPDSQLLVTFGGLLFAEGTGKALQITSSLSLARITSEPPSIEFLADHKVSSSHPTARAHHSACLVGERRDKIVIFGGELEDGSLTDELWLLQISVGLVCTFKRLATGGNGSGPAARKGGLLAGVPGSGEFVLAGGEGSGGAKLKDAWLFDPQTGRWTALPDLPAGVAEGVMSIETVRQTNSPVDMYVVLVSGRFLFTLSLGVESGWRHKDLGQQVNVTHGVRTLAKIENRLDPHAICFLLLGSRTAPAHLLSLPGFDPRVKISPALAAIRAAAFTRLSSYGQACESLAVWEAELPEGLQNIVTHPVLGLRGFLAALGLDQIGMRATVGSSRRRKDTYILRCEELEHPGFQASQVNHALASFHATAAFGTAILVGVSSTESGTRTDGALMDSTVPVPKRLVCMCVSGALREALKTAQMPVVEFDFDSTLPPAFARLVRTYGEAHTDGDVEELIADVKQNGGVGLIMYQVAELARPDDMSWMRGLLPGKAAPTTIFDYMPAFDLNQVRRVLKKPAKEVDLSGAGSALAGKWTATMALYKQGTFGVLIYAQTGRLIRRLHGHLPAGPRHGKVAAIVEVTEGFTADPLLADFSDTPAVDELLDQICQVCEEFLG